MEKKAINFGTSLPYKAPKCKCVELRVQSLLCASPTFGDGSSTDSLVDDGGEEEEPYFKF